MNETLYKYRTSGTFLGAILLVFSCAAFAKNGAMNGATDGADVKARDTSGPATNVQDRAAKEPTTGEQVTPVQAPKERPPKDKPAQEKPAPRQPAPEKAPNDKTVHEQAESEDELLGELSGKRYTAPDNCFRVMSPEIPSAQDDTTPITIRDTLSRNRCTVVFKRDEPNTAAYRIDMARKTPNVEIPEDLDSFARSNFAPFLSILQSMHKQAPVKIDSKLLRVGGHAAVAHVYKQTPGDQALGVDARFHQMILVNYPRYIGFIWSEFTVARLTIEAEENIVDGKQPEIQQGMNLLATLEP